MIKVYRREKFGDVVTVVISSKFKEVIVTSCVGSNCYRSPSEEHDYGSMGSYINSWLKALNGLQPVVVMDD